MRGSIQIRRCYGCQDEFLRARSTQYNGRAKWMCDDCYVTVKHCRTCDRVLPLEAFNTAADKRNGRNGRCKECLSREWSTAPTAHRRRAKLRARGVTHDEYLQMLARQQSLCAICNQPETDVHNTGRVRELAIDHDHESGAVRALLCGRCNKAIGLMLDDPDRLRSAAAYLERWAAA